MTIRQLTVRRAFRASGTADPQVARLHAGGLVIPCVLGRNGMTFLKREGDGRTPRGRFELVSFYFRADRLRRIPAAMPMKAIGPGDGWCDDPGHRQYNRAVGLPFSGRHEKLWRTDHLYDLVGVLDYNFRRRSTGRGSAIFFHVMDTAGSPTEGCVAVRLDDLRKLIPRLAAKTWLVVC